MADLRVWRVECLPHGDRDQSHTWPPHINGSSENVPRRLMNPSLSLLPVINHPAIPFLLYTIPRVEEPGRWGSASNGRLQSLDAKFP